MSLVVSGLSHHTSGLDLRERFLFDAASIPPALIELRRRVEGAGAVILSTCNRTEIYLHHAADAEDLHREVRRFLSDWKRVPEAEFVDALYDYRDRETVGHLFRVASSLDSLVVGEGQILGQVHDAYLLAQAEQATDKIINALFQRAFAIAKRVRARTDIGEGKVSISSVAVDLAVSIFMDLADKTVLVIGSGEMGDLTLKSLVEKGARKVIVVNRDPAKAAEAAARYSGEAAALDALGEHLHRADIVISSTAAPGLILGPEQFREALKRRGAAPMFVIDIAAPRDVDPAVNEIDNVYLYDLDDLREVADRNLEARRAEMDRCLEIVEAGVEQFWRWMHGLVAEPTIVSLSTELNAIRERELAKTLAALPDLDEKQRAEIEYLTKRIISNVLQRPLAQLKQEAHHHDSLHVLQLVRRLFGLKEST